MVASLGRRRRRTVTDLTTNIIRSSLKTIAVSPILDLPQPNLSELLSHNTRVC